MARCGRGWWRAKNPREIAVMKSRKRRTYEFDYRRAAIISFALVLGAMFGRKILLQPLGENMNIGNPVRTFVVEPLDEFVSNPTSEPRPEPLSSPEPTPEEAPAAA
jgi:hypothetical protein